MGFWSDLGNNAITAGTGVKGGLAGLQSLNDSSAAKAVMDKYAADFKNRGGQIAARNQAANNMSGNYGAELIGGAGGLAHGVADTIGRFNDKAGGIAGKIATGIGAVTDYLAASPGFTDSIMTGLGFQSQTDSLQGKLSRAANTAAGWATANADAQNDKAREQIIQQGQAAADNYNFNAQQMQSDMTDSAIGQANAYQGGMQAIGMNGIEGSDNMERNLQYGQDRADAQEQLAYDMMGNQAQGISDSMVQSFDQLSQNKVATTQNAWSGAVNGYTGAMNAAEQQAAAYQMQNQVTQQDMYKMLQEAQDAAGGMDKQVEAADPTGVGAAGGGAGTGGADIGAWLKQNHAANGLGWKAAVQQGKLQLPPGISIAEIETYVKQNPGSWK